MRCPALRAASLALPVVVGACSLGPAYRRPVVDVPPGFAATPATARSAWPSPRWWEKFNSPELDDLIALARSANQDLAAAAARIVQADAQVRISGAPLLPALNGELTDNYSRQGTGSSTSARSFPGSPRYFDFRTYGAQLQVSYDLDFWGRNRALYRSAEAAALASRFDQETVALNVVASVANTYFALLAAQDRLRVAERNLADAEAILAAYRARVAAGTSTALDVAQQEALAAGERALIPALRNSVEQERIGLGILTGQPPERLRVEGGSLDALRLPDVAPGLPSGLLARRPDVAFAEANLVSQNGNIQAARAAFFPDVQLTGSGGLQSAVLSSITGPGTVIAALTASVLQPIFDNGLRAGEYRQAQGRFEELAATYRTSVLQAFTDVETALAALSYATEQERLEREAVRIAQESANIAAAQLLAGTIDIVTQLNTEATLFNDLDLLAQIRLARFQALVNLYKALGGGWSGEASA
jgi:NodT family efflux transporter outer membrane factor (OMF) lipoprotein